MLVELCAFICVVRKLAENECARFGACVLIKTNAVLLKSIRVFFLFKVVASTKNQ